MKDIYDNPRFEKYLEENYTYDESCDAYRWDGDDSLTSLHDIAINWREDKNEFKTDLFELLAELKAKREAAKKREEVEAYWNAPLDLKDRD